MNKLKTSLGFVAALLGSFIVIEAVYYTYVVVVDYKDYASFDLSITIFINFSSIFFVAVLFLGLIQFSEYLLKTWLIYSLVEISRSCMTLYDSLMDLDSKLKERAFVITDVAVQLILIVIVLILLRIIRNGDKKTALTVGRDIELTEKNKIKSRVID